MTRARRIAAGLGVCAGVLGLLCLVLWLGFGRGYGLRGLDPAQVPPLPQLELGAEAPRMPAASSYGDILVRPLFSPTRQPEALADVGSGEAAVVSAPLNVTLAGVVMRGDTRIALVINNANQQTLSLRVGQPLEGDQAGWTLAELNPRAAVFDGGSLGTQEIELTTDTAGLPMPTGAVTGRESQPGEAAPQMVPPDANQAADALTMPTPPPPQGATPSEEEIRKRIEERRRQLREEAERLMKQQQTQPPGG